MRRIVRDRTPSVQGRLTMGTTIRLNSLIFSRRAGLVSAMNGMPAHRRGRTDGGGRPSGERFSKRCEFHLPEQVRDQIWRRRQLPSTG